MASEPAAKRNAGDVPDFNKEVRTILSDKCFRCHGPDEAERYADLRFDVRESAIEDRGGSAAIVPGDVEASQLWDRINHEDDDLLMPPPDSHLSL
ncbi:MAG: c-type cytochrome domain-containing protein, partial [Planctomycetota bacterium]